MRTHPAPHRGHGYTLTELAVILAVAGLVLAISGPAFSRYQQSLAARNAHRQLVQDLRLARQKALSEHQDFVGVFDSAPPSGYGVFADADGDRVRDAGERWLVQRTLPGSLGLDAGGLTPADSLAFTAAGNLPGGWTGGVIRILDGSGSERRVRAWPSGSIEMVQP